MNTKQCRACQQFKSVEEFWKSRRNKDGRFPKCKACVSETRKEKGFQWSGKQKSQQVYNFSLKGKITHWKSSAKLRGIDWKLTEEDLQRLPMICVYTGQNLVFESRLLNTVSLDRIDSAKCYEPGNIVFCCEKLNKMKQDLTVNQFLQICNDVASRSKIILEQLR